MLPPEPSACSANPWRHSVPSYSVPLHATDQLLPPVCRLGGSGSVPTPSPRDRRGSCCSLPCNVQWHLIRPLSGTASLPEEGADRRLREGLGHRDTGRLKGPTRAEEVCVSALASVQPDEAPPPHQHPLPPAGQRGFTSSESPGLLGCRISRN